MASSTIWLTGRFFSQTSNSEKPERLLQTCRVSPSVVPTSSWRLLTSIPIPFITGLRIVWKGRELPRLPSLITASVSSSNCSGGSREIPAWAPSSKAIVEIQAYTAAHAGSRHLRCQISIR